MQFEGNQQNGAKPTSSGIKVALFFILVILMVYGLTMLSHKTYYLNNVIPLLTIIIFMCMYALNGIHHKKLFKPINYLFPLYVCLSISFAVISVIFGLHTDVFISYDKSNSISSDPNKWMKIDQILQFPLSQINSAESPITQQVNFKELVKIDTTCHIIVIDKTLSNKNSEAFIDSFLTSKILSTFYIEPTLLSNAKTSDLIPPYIFSGLYNQANNSTFEKVSIWYYTGESELLFINYNKSSGYTFDILNEIKNPQSDFIDNYFEKMQLFNDKYKGRSGKSQLNDIINSLNNIVNQPSFKEYDSLKISVISDFINSTEIGNNLDFHQVENLSQLNLYCMDGKDGDNPTCSAFEVIGNATDDYSLLRPKTVIDLKSERQASDFFYDLSLSNCQYFDHKNKRELEFVYPYKSFNTKEKAISQLVFIENKLKPNHKKVYYLKVYDDENSENNFPVLYKTNYMSKEIVSKAGNLVPIEIFKDDTLEITLPFSYTLANKRRLYFEVSSLEDNKTEAYSIAFNPRMPDTTSYYLIFCYSIFVISMSLILILPNLFVFQLYVQNRLKTTFIFINGALILPLAMGAFWTWYFYSTLIQYDCLNNVIKIIPIILLGFCLPRFFQTYRKYYARNENGNPRIYNAKMWGTLWNDLKIFLYGKT